ncbi:hypothetical protein [Duganella sp. BuS-21]|uniref:hypothetical protein n=1 Tax=Duganella sp. BuS-21 TaxID=2943848 RepID=UPI0035A592D7
MDELNLRRGTAVSLYGLFSGQTKPRMGAGYSMGEQRAWNVSVISTGEVSMAEHVKVEDRRQIKEGEAARMLDVPIDELLPCGDTVVVDALKNDCDKYFGTAGPAFARMVLTRFGGDPAVTSSTIVSEVDALRDLLCEEAVTNGFKLKSQHRRAMRRFGLAALAGKWAAAEGILPHTEEEVMAAVRAVRDTWLGGQAYQSEEAQAIVVIRDYIQRFHGQMLVTGSPRSMDRPPSNCHGILHHDRVLLTDDQFRAACGGLDARMVARALDEAGVLHRQDDQYKAKVSIAELQINKVRFYDLKLDRLFDEAADDGAEPH